MSIQWDLAMRPATFSIHTRSTTNRQRWPGYALLTLWLGVNTDSRQSIAWGVTRASASFFRIDVQEHEASYASYYLSTVTSVFGVCDFSEVVSEERSFKNKKIKNNEHWDRPADNALFPRHTQLWLFSIAAGCTRSVTEYTQSVRCRVWRQPRLQAIIGPCLGW